MKQIYLTLALLFSAPSVDATEPAISPSTDSAIDTVGVMMPQTPILIERQDNILFNIRVVATTSKTFNGVTVEFGPDVRLSDIKSLELYYSGTEGVDRRGFHWSSCDYLSHDVPSSTLSANASYSSVRATVTRIDRRVTLSCSQPLWRGTNYFWVSISMRPRTSILSTITARVSRATIDSHDSPLYFADSTTSRRMGIGVRYAGDDGASAYRIPGLVTSKRGTLLGVYDIRYNNSGDLQEHIEIGVSRSTDGGQHWGKMIHAMSMGEYGSMPLAQNGVGDPAILVDDRTGTIWIVAAWTHGMGGQRAWFNSQSGIEPERTAQLLLSRSDDDGVTWSSPINITSQVKDPSWRFLLQGPGSGITMDDGTLVFATQYIDSVGIPNAAIMYSRDRGGSWSMHNLARTNTTEAQVAEVEPGVLMLNMRDNRGGSRAVATTRDLGRTWTEHPSSRSVLQEPVCMASLLAVKAADNVLGRDILLFANPNTTKGRHSITIKMSLDGGQTFPDSVLLDSQQGWGYSCLTMIDPSTIGILYEGSTAHLVFQAIKLSPALSKKPINIH